MIDKEQAKLEMSARLYRAIGHPTRLFMLQRLAERERSVGEFCEMIPVDISTISKHLAVLRHAGIVKDRKKGNQVFYQLRMTWIPNLINGVEAAMDGALKEG
jgi:DNA-binding transcriptional ArsR family regulator